MNHDEQEPEEGFKHLSGILAGLFSPDVMIQPEPESKPAPPAKTKAKKSASDKLVRASVAIHERPDETEAAYLARELVQCTLPHRDPGAVNGWKRSNGNLTLVLQSALDTATMKPLGLPYGSIPRLILLWIVTEAVRTKSRHIKLGNTLNDFLRDIGLDPNTGGGKRGDATRLKEQMRRLFNCRISFEYSGGTKTQGFEARLNMEVASRVLYWWSFKEPEQISLFESELLLGEEFYKAITAAPVPLDWRALVPLKQSPLAIDLYTWATYRIFTMRRKGEKQISVPLADLKEQFGSEYARLDHFKAAFVEALTKVQHVFPDLSYRLEKNTFVLRDNKARLAISATGEEKAQNELTSIDRVSDRARAWFKGQFPHMDVEAAIADFYSWRADKGEVSMNTDRHFKGFAKTWEERNR